MRKQAPKTKVPASVRLGVYQHYKGPLYIVIGVARNANKDKERSVVYFSPAPHGNEVPMLNYRKVDGKDGFFTPVRIKGKLQERFTYLYPVNISEIRRPVIEK